MSAEPAEIVTSTSNLKQKFKLTRKQIILAVVILAAIGAAFLIRSFAAENVVATLKGYTMVYQVGNTTKVSKVTDSGATDKTALGMYWQGTASQTLTLPKVTKISIRAKANVCNGSPIMVLRIDNTETTRWTVDATQWTTYSQDVALAAGTHNIQVVFANDYSNRRCDRNLYLDTINFIGVTPETTPAVQAPVLKVSGQSISWNSLQGVSKYVLATTIGTDRSTTKYTQVTGTSLTPAAVPGKTVYYGLRADASGSPWAQEVAITYPSDTTTPTNPTPTTPTTPGGGSNMIVGFDIGNFGSAGANEAKSITNYVRIEEGRVPTSIYKAVGVKMIVNFSGPYNSSGVSALNATSWANEKLNWYKTNCGDVNTCPAVEILNEPGGTWFWGSNALSQTNANAYANLLKVTANTFRTALGANTPKILATYDGSHEGSAGAMAFGNKWWAADTDHSYVDGIIVHPYGLNSVPRADSAKGNQTLITSVRTKTNKPLYITEVGWPTATSQPSTGDSYQWSEAEQAANIHNFINWSRGTGYINAVMIFNYRDYSTNMWYGITRGDGTKKPSFNALKCAIQNKPLGCQ